MRADPSNADLSLPDQMGVALKHAGVSITITTVTDVFAFGVGALSVSYIVILFMSQSQVFLRLCLDCNLFASAQPWLLELYIYCK